MTLPPNIKEEIEKEAEKLCSSYSGGPGLRTKILDMNSFTKAIELATQFYLKGVEVGKAIAEDELKRAYYKGREHGLCKNCIHED